MSFNVWYGGVSIDSGQIAAAVRAADADVVGVQEPEGNLRRIADAAGLPVRRREPAPDLALSAVRRRARRSPLRLRRGRPATRSSRSPTCTCPAALRAEPGRRRQAGRRRARARAPHAAARDRAVRSSRSAKLADEGVPLFMTGDFNSPSHLDWTEEAAARRATSPIRSSGPRRRRSPTRAFATPTATPTRTRRPTPGLDLDRRPAAAADAARRRPTTGSTGCWPPGPSETPRQHWSARRAGPTSRSASRPGAPTTAPSSRASRSSRRRRPYLVSAIAAGRRARRAGDAALHAGRAAARPRRSGSSPAREGPPERSRCRRSRSSTPPTTSRRCSAPRRWRPARYRAALLDRDGEAARHRRRSGSPSPAPSRGSRPRRADLRARRAGTGPLAGRARPTSSTGSRIFPAGDPSLYGYIGFRYTGAAARGLDRVQRRRHRRARAGPLPGAG